MKPHLLRMILAGLALLGVDARIGSAQPRVDQRVDPNEEQQVMRGRYLTRAGDCKACHTAEGGAAFAGGRAVPTPFGTIYSTNITPDKDTGIGRWDAADFYRAMHEGIDREGKHLYPAFPYPWYSRLSRDDVLAIKAYLQTLPAVRQINREPDLPWPLSWRAVMRVWNGMYFDEGTYRPDPQHSAEWNRGAYLVDGAGHCGACHTEKNFAGATDKDNPLRGGFGENAFAPNLAGGVRDGLANWSVDEVARFLATGSNRHTSAAGPMSEVVEQSTQYLSRQDLLAIASYLKDLPGEHRDPSAARAVIAGDDERMRRGAALYIDQCAGCHMSGGTGIADVFPPLKTSPSVQAEHADTLVGVVLNGARKPATSTDRTALAMPPFGTKLDDAEIADVVTYIRNAWGNRADTVSAHDVANLREKTRSAGG